MQRVLEFGAQLLSSGGQVSVKLHHSETVNCGEQILFCHTQNLSSQAVKAEGNFDDCAGV
jgi:hypothetical protein